MSANPLSFLIMLLIDGQMLLIHNNQCNTAHRTPTIYLYRRFFL